MAQRLGDEQFAREIYTDIRDQAIRAAERWYDVEARVRLSTAVERSTAGTPLLDVTVEWEYTTVPSGSERRFACVSDRAAYNALVMDTPITTTWLMTPRPGMDAASRRCFELLSFTIDGEEMPIRRTEHEGGQTYIVDTSVAAAAGNPVRIRHVYRTVTLTWGHRIYVELPQPARGFSFDLDYTNTSIDDISVTDMAANGRPSSRRQSRQLADRSASVYLGGCCPRAVSPSSGRSKMNCPRAGAPRQRSAGRCAYSVATTHHGCPSSHHEIRCRDADATHQSVDLQVAGGQAERCGCW